MDREARCDCTKYRRNRRPGLICSHQSPTPFDSIERQSSPKRLDSSDRLGSGGLNSLIRLDSLKRPDDGVLINRTSKNKYQSIVLLSHFRYISYKSISCSRTVNCRILVLPACCSSTSRGSFPTHPNVIAERPNMGSPNASREPLSLRQIDVV